jgi:hypothetical protein
LKALFIIDIKFAYFGIGKKIVSCLSVFMMIYDEKINVLKLSVKLKEIIVGG